MIFVAAPRQTVGHIRTAARVSPVNAKFQRHADPLRAKDTGMKPFGKWYPTWLWIPEGSRCRAVWPALPDGGVRAAGGRADPLTA